MNDQTDRPAPLPPNTNTCGFCGALQVGGSPVPPTIMTTAALCESTAKSVERLQTYFNVRGPLVLIGNEAKLLSDRCREVLDRLMEGGEKAPTNEQLNLIHDAPRLPGTPPATPDKPWMVRTWRDLAERIERKEITTSKAVELFVGEFPVAGVSITDEALTQGFYALGKQMIDPRPFWSTEERAALRAAIIATVAAASSSGMPAETPDEDADWTCLCGVVHQAHIRRCATCEQARYAARRSRPAETPEAPKWNPDAITAERMEDVRVNGIDTQPRLATVLNAFAFVEAYRSGMPTPRTGEPGQEPTA